MRRNLGHVLVAGLMVAVIGCSSGSGDDADDSANARRPISTGVGADGGDDDATDAGTRSDDLPRLADLECGEAAHPCDWSEAADGVFEHALGLGDRAIASYVEGASLTEVAVELAADERVVSTFVDERAILFRVDGGPSMWVLGDAAFSLVKSAPASPPATARRVDVPLPRDVVGDNPEVKRALVISPYEFEFGDRDDAAAVAALYAGARGYEGNVTYVANTDTELQVTRDAFMNWDQYDVVHVSTHGTQICDGEACRTMLLMGKSFVSKEILFAEDGGSTVTFSRNGRTLGVSDERFRMLYPGGLPDTVIVLSACETGKGEELTSAFGAGVSFSWTEDVFVTAATAASIALHGEMIEFGSTTTRAYEVLGSRGMTSYEEVKRATPQRTGTYVVGPDGSLVPVMAPGEASTVTVRLVRRTTSDGDLRVREVAWVEHPETGGELLPGAEVRVRIASDADYMPVRLRVEGIDPGDERSTKVRLEVNGIEMDSWNLGAEGSATGVWGEWVITDEVKLLNRIKELDEVDLRMIVDLPEGGESEHTVERVPLTCLLGTWRVRSQEFAEQMAAFADGSEGGPVSIDHTAGEWTIVIRADGTVLNTQAGWELRTTSRDGTLWMILDSQYGGVWSAADGVFTVNDEPSTGTVRMDVLMNGSRQPIPFLGSQQVEVEAITGSADYSCDDNVLRLEKDGVTFTLDLMDVE